MPKKKKLKMPKEMSVNEFIAAGAELARKHQGMVTTPRFCDFKKTTETYSIKFLTGNVQIVLGVNYESGKITLGKLRSGEKSFIFSESDPGVAAEVLDLLSFAAHKAQQLLAEYQEKQPSKAEEKK